MRRIDRLIKEAKESMIFRGHKPTRTDVSKLGGIRTAKRWYSVIIYCKDCDMWVQCLDKPDPNQIDIGGPAVALNCRN